MPTYQIENVWQNKTEALRNEIIQFWLDNGALPGRPQADKRADQVVFLARDAEGRIAAVNTVYPQFNRQLEKNFFYYRVFVSEGHRRNSLADRLTVAACDFFNRRFVEGHNPRIIGLFAVIESKILQQYASQAVRPSGFFYIGKDERGNHQRVYYFDGACI